MGTYSYFDYEDIEVKDWEGLKNFLELWEKTNPDYWIKKEYMIDEKEKSFSFRDWSDIKLISYWYNLDLLFLECIAKYIEGSEIGRAHV